MNIFLQFNKIILKIVLIKMFTTYLFTHLFYFNIIPALTLFFQIIIKCPFDLKEF